MLNFSCNINVLRVMSPAGGARSTWRPVVIMLVLMPRKRVITDGDERLAVGYVRVSKADRDESNEKRASLSVEAQRAAIEAWAERTGRTIVGVFAEEDGEVSGDDPVDRSPALLEALGAIEDHGARWLVAVRRDRVARDVEKAGDVQRRLARLGARIVTPDGLGEQQESATTRFVWRIVDAANQFELELIRERTAEALAAKRAKGERVGTIPYGKRLGAGKLLEDDPDEQKVIEEIVALNREGKTAARIARLLTRRRVRRRGGKVIWAGDHVARILAGRVDSAAPRAPK